MPEKPNEHPNANRGESKFGLTCAKDGWYRRVDGVTRYIAGFRKAPTAADADAVFVRRYPEWTGKKELRTDITLGYLADAFVDWKRGTVELKTLRDYSQIALKFVRFIGKGSRLDEITPEEFTAFAKTFASQSIYRREKHVVCIRTMFNFAIGQGWIQSINYGPAFIQPKMREKRINAVTRPRRFYEAGEIRTLLDGADPQLKAAIYLGINGGLGNKDVAQIRREMIEGDMLIHNRVKNGAQRTVALWLETVKALKSLTPNESGLLFHTSWGTPLVTDDRDTLADWFRERCEAAGVRCLGFYSLRRTFRTVADSLPDRRAVDVVMGHVQNDIASIYVQHIDPNRLREVTKHVRLWLLSPGEGISSGEKQGAGSSPRPAKRKAANGDSDKHRRSGARE